MILNFALSLLLPLTAGCPENPLPPCVCTYIGHIASYITCEKVNSEYELVRSMLSMKESKVPIRYVQIFDSAVTYLPSRLFDGMNFQRLFIAGCSMSALTDTDIAFEGLQGLEQLWVHETILHSDWRWSHLRNLTSLRELQTIKTGMLAVDGSIGDIAHLDISKLSLTQDHISFVHETAFAPYGNLDTLSLKMNEIETLKRSMFPNPATQFRQLILSHNKIQHLPPDIFSAMPQLMSVILADNHIFTVSKETFQPVWKNLMKVDLLANPLRCDCRMEWILYELSHPRNLWATCTQPAGVKNKEIRDLVKADLWC